MKYGGPVTEYRTVVWFSCGIASACVARIVKDENPDSLRIVYCDTASEHEDNKRFLRDCSEWLNHEIEVIRSAVYQDTWDVFKRTRWLVGPQGARCTTELKKVPRHRFQRPDDAQCWGYSSGEQARADRFMQNNPEVISRFPLIERGMTKADCAAMIRDAGIEVPAMYRLGYRNNNCIGCVKGQGGYWNKIRKDFPDVFARMALVERDIGAAICKTYAGDGKRKPLYLDELPHDFGRYEAEPDISCGPMCGLQMGLFQ